MEVFQKHTIHYPPITNHPDTNITVTGTIPRSKGELIDGMLIVRPGVILPSNDANAQFVVDNNATGYDVTDGDAAGSLILQGRILRQRLPEQPTPAAEAALAKRGIFIDEADEFIRPNFGEVEVLEPIATPTLTDNPTAKKFTWMAVPNAKAYQVFENDRVVAMILAGQTLEYTYGSLTIDRDFNVKAIGDNLRYGNSEMSDTLTIPATTGGTL